MFPPFLWQYWQYFALPTLLVQVFFAVHAVRSGRPYYWLWIIFAFPLVGCLVYFFAEYLPYTRAGGIEGVGKALAKTLNPGAEIRRLQDQLAVTPSVQNRIELARAYVAAGKPAEAVSLYEACLQGLHQDDPRVLYELAAAYHAGGRLEDARRTYERFRTTTAPSKEQQLLSARIHEDAGDLEAALLEYAALARSSAGEEARVRYALLLRRIGRGDEAVALFEETLRHARLSPSHYRRTQKHWIGVAKSEAKKGPAAAR